MENINLVVAKNLISLRKAHRMTQAELAQKLNYSDKSISKWETGETAPSVEVLARLAEVFGVGVEYFLTENARPEVSTNLKPQKNKIIITLLSISLVWLVALAVFTIFMVTMKINLWTLYIWAVPASLIITTVFACIWLPTRSLKYISISALLWTLIAATYIQFWAEDMWMLFIVAVPVQVAVILWAFRNKRLHKSVNKE